MNNFKAGKRSHSPAKQTEVDGKKFASKQEAKRYRQLKLLEMAKEIKDLECHPVYRIDINGQHICKVIPDFQYFDIRKGIKVVEDLKGHTHEFKKKIGKFRARQDGHMRMFNLKNKLMKACHGIEIQVVTV